MGIGAAREEEGLGLMLLVSGLAKSYGATPALREVDLALEHGIVALLGPNGSGKTTLLRCLASALRPDSGKILWRGRRLWPDPRFLRAHLGYLPQELEFPGQLTPRRLLAHLGRLKGCHSEGQAERLLADLRLAEVATRPFAALSAGQIRMVGVAQALLGHPALLLLDEPTRNLDIEERQTVFSQLRRRAAEALVLFSTHVPDDVAQGAQEVVVLKEGRVCHAGGIEELRRGCAGQVHEVCVGRGGVDRLPPDCRVSRRIESDNGTVARAVGRVPPGYPAVAVEPTLEEAYLLLVGDDEEKKEEMGRAGSHR